MNTPLRVTFYIDGFNFYNGLKHAVREDKTWKKYYWLDLVSFANQFLDKSHELVVVKYFTAPPLDAVKESRQAALFKANQLINGSKIEFIKCKYYKEIINCMGSCKEVFLIPEQKRTDVNICIQMIEDCIANSTDILVLISAYSDLVPPIEFIKKSFPEKRIRVYFPLKRRSSDLMRASDNKVTFLKDNKLKFDKSVMPHQVTKHNVTANIPASWIYK